MQRNKILIIGALIVGLLVIFSLGISAYQLYVGTNNNQLVLYPTQTTTPTISVTALPVINWKTTKYNNGQGSKVLMSGTTYTGVTGVTINDGTDNVFTLQAVYGVGGADFCQDIYKFADTDASFIQQKRDDAKNNGGITSTIVDLTGSPYVELKIYGARFRRIDSSLYWTSSADPKVFNPECGASKNIAAFSGLGFKAGSISDNKYQFLLKQGLSDAELKSFDNYIGTQQ